jgi:hypothetical protein
MVYVYIVIENGVSYNAAYQTYAQAVAVVHDKWNTTVQQERDEAGGYDICSEIDLPENPSGETMLYVEKGINILILRLPIVSTVY